MLSIGSPALIAVLLVLSLYLLAAKMPKTRNRANESVGELQKGFEDFE